MPQIPTTATPMPPIARCPCGTGLTYGECCERYLRGSAPAPTAERLMRSRYTAYTLGATTYLLATWHRSTRPATLSIDPDRLWIGLEILEAERGGMLDIEGTVEFRAIYRHDGMRLHQHENSTFVREARRWYYVDGTLFS